MRDGRPPLAMTNLAPHCALFIITIQYESHTLGWLNVIRLHKAIE